jgi:hypothetical protein
MATYTGSTTTSTLGALIGTEQIDEIIQDPNVAPAIHQVVAWARNASAGNSESYKFPSLDEPTITFTEASPKTEDDTAGFGDADAINATAATATAAVVGVKRRLSYEAAQDASYTIQDAFRNTLIGMRKRITTDLLLNLVGLSGGSDFSGLALNIQRLGVAQATYGAQNPHMTPGGFALILHDDQYRDLAADIRLTNASIEATGRNVALLSLIPGFKGFYEDLAVFVTGLVGAPDGSNWEGGIVSIGERGALGMAVWDMGNTSKGFSVNGILNEADRDIDAQADVLVTSSRYGTCITKAANAHSIISRT